MLTAAFVGFGQNAFVKKWDYSYGGSREEELRLVTQTEDGGFILSGKSFSPISGNKTQGNWDTSFVTGDYWIVKVDSNGNKQWDERYGGNNSEILTSLIQTKDGGFLLGGESYSSLSGDKSSVKLGTSDGWLVKIDSLGNLLWQKRYGGNREDYIVSIIPAHDGGFLLGAVSYSNASGEKSHNNWDPSGFQADYWVIKIDTLGNIEWDSVYGGTGYEELSNILSTDDNGYLLCGTSGSDSSGTKSQNSIGPTDYWAVKIDSVGRKVWDKRYGVSNSSALDYAVGNNKQGYLLTGWGGAGISSDKTFPNSSFWILNIDSNGIRQWDRVIPEISYEYYRNNITLTKDGGYLLAASSNKNTGGNKTETNLGVQQTWIIKLDSLGYRQWDKTLLTLEHDRVGYALELDQDCYLFGNCTSSDVGGYKTQPNLGEYDFWITKFCMEPVGIQVVDPHTQVNVYPNPFAHDISITLQKEHPQQATFAISNSIGQIIYSRTETNISNTYTKNLDLSNLPDGIYFVEINVDGEKIIKQVVKQ